MSRKLWTSEEDKAFRYLAEKGAPVSEIAKALDRTEAAIRSRAEVKKIRIKRGAYTNRIKKPEEKKKLWMSEQEIASKVRRGVDVRILAELNLTTPEYIRTIARSAGVKEILDQSKMRYTDHGIHRVSHQ